MLDVESKRGYWLTVYAQDHGVVPLSSSLQVCIEKINYMYNVLRYPEKYYAFRNFYQDIANNKNTTTNDKYILS